jgi:hypothetical protein
MATAQLILEGLFRLAAVWIAACTACCAPITEHRSETVLAWRHEHGPARRALDHDTFVVAAIRDGVGVRVRVSRSEACAVGAREWVYVQENIERNASLPALLLEGALVVAGAAVTVVAARKAAEDPRTLDASGNQFAGVAAGAGGVLTAVAATALSVDLLSSRNSTQRHVRKGRPDRITIQPCRVRPATDSLVSLSLGDDTIVEGITDEAGEVLLAVPSGLPANAFGMSVVTVDGRPLGPLEIAPAPCR